MRKQFNVTVKSKFGYGSKVRINPKYSIAPGLKSKGIDYNTVLTINDIRFINSDVNGIEYWFNECDYAIWEYMLIDFDSEVINDNAMKCDMCNKSTYIIHINTNHDKVCDRCYYA